jgi:dihydrofolate reductase
MAELFLQISVSLDGFIEDRSGDLSWFTEDTSLDELATETLEAIDGMIFGRKAHAALAAFWPTAAESSGASTQLIKQTALMNKLPKYVLTHGEEQTGWSNSYAIRLHDIPRILSEARRPIALFAGASAAQAALDSGFVDEIRLIQYPVILGAGTPLFQHDGKRRDLKLIDSQSFDSGATVQRYRVKDRTR